MPTEVDVTDDAKNLIQDIILKYNLDPKSNVKYNVGADVGDGYMSRTIAVDIENEENPISLFMKCALNMKATPIMDVAKIYFNEIYFYDVIYPEYLKFASERNIENVSSDVPKCYGTFGNKILALENLKKKGYDIFKRTNVMNDRHITLVLKAFARFHAFSMAYKDQKKKEYDTMTEKIQLIFDPERQNYVLQENQRQMINDCMAQWDPVKDEYILSRTENLAANLVRRAMTSVQSKDEHSVIVKGDCWSNNVMFHYEGENRENPSDAMLIDWQIIHEGSLVLDISYFFYTVASKEALGKLNYYLKLYYEELSNHIKQLGSDPDIIYPYSLLEKEWKRHCVYGYLMTFVILKVMLIPKEDAPNMEKIDFDNTDIKDVYKLKDQTEYMRRIKILTEHMVENDFLNFD